MCLCNICRKWKPTPVNTTSITHPVTACGSAFRDMIDFSNKFYSVNKVSLIQFSLYLHVWKQYEILKFACCAQWAAVTSSARSFVTSSCVCVCFTSGSQVYSIAPVEQGIKCRVPCSICSKWRPLCTSWAALLHYDQHFILISNLVSLVFWKPVWNNFTVPGFQLSLSLQRHSKQGHTFTALFSFLSLYPYLLLK